MITITFRVTPDKEKSVISYVENGLKQPNWGIPFKVRTGSDGKVVYRIHGTGDDWQIVLGHLRARGAISDIQKLEL